MQKVGESEEKADKKNLVRKKTAPTLFNKKRCLLWDSAFDDDVRDGGGIRWRQPSPEMVRIQLQPVTTRDKWVY